MTDELPGHSTRALMPGRNGGSLRVGGTNRGGPGRPPDALRFALQGRLEDQLRVADDIMAGRPFVVGMDGQTPAYAYPTIDHRIKILEWLAKYSIGTQKDIQKTTRQLQIRVVREGRDLRPGIHSGAVKTSRDGEP